MAAAATAGGSERARPAPFARGHGPRVDRMEASRGCPSRDRPPAGASRAAWHSPPPSSERDVGLREDSAHHPRYGREGVDRIGEDRDWRTELYREHRFVDRLGCRGPPDERTDDDLVLPIDDDRDMPFRFAHVALRARGKVGGLLERVDATFLRLIQEQANPGCLRIGVDGAGRRAEIGADLVAERDLDSDLALVVTEMGRDFVPDAIADGVDVLGGAKRVADREEIPAVVRDPDRIEAKTGEGGLGGASHVELDHSGLDRRSVRELDDMLAAHSRARPDALGARVLPHVDARRSERLREERRAPRVIRRVDLPGAHDGGAYAEPRVDLRQLGTGRSGAKDRDAFRELAEARPFLVRPEARLGETVELRHLSERADCDDDVLRLELARLAVGPHNHLAGAGERRRATHRNDPGGLVVANVARVVGIVPTFAHDHVVAPRRRLLPGILATVGADLGSVEQRLRWHAAPERAGSAEEIALDECDGRAAGAGVAGRGLARYTRADDDEVEPLGHARSA